MISFKLFYFRVCFKENRVKNFGQARLDPQFQLSVPNTWAQEYILEYIIITKDNHKNIQKYIIQKELNVFSFNEMLWSNC